MRQGGADDTPSAMVFSTTNCIQNPKSDLKVRSIWAAGSDRQPPAAPMMARRRSEFQKSELRTPIEFRAACGHGLIIFFWPINGTLLLPPNYYDNSFDGQTIC